MTSWPNQTSPVKDLKHSSESWKSRVWEIVQVLLVIFVACGVFFKVCYPVESSNDVWWHLKTGHYLLDYWSDHGFAFPEHDVFSISGENLPWANHEWLADILMFLCYDRLSLMGLILVKSALITGAFLFLLWLMCRGTKQTDSEDPLLLSTVPLACFMTILAFMASQYTMYLRPPVLTYLFLVLLMHLMLNVSKGDNWWKTASFWLLVPLMVLWVNLHGGAVLGIVVAGLRLGGALAEGIVRRVFTKRPFCVRECLRWACVTGILFVSSLVNPFGYHIHLLTLKIMKNPMLIHKIGELQSPNFHFAFHYELLIVLLVFLLVLGRKLKVWEFFVLGFFLHQSLNHVRHLPVFALIASPVLMRHLWSWISQQKRLTRLASNTVITVSAFCLSMTAINEGLQQEVSRFIRHEGIIEEAYPVRACNFLEYFGLPGPVFHPINFAGYLIWRFSPEQCKVFTDSRFDIHGSEAMLECLAVDQVDDTPAYIAALKVGQGDLPAERREQPYWRYVLDKYGFNLIITSSDSRLALFLQGDDKGWVEVYRQASVFLDGRGYVGYVIYLRDVSENQALISQLRGEGDSEEAF